jgi:D-glycerate 3-kinase
MNNLMINLKANKKVIGHTSDAYYRQGQFKGPAMEPVKSEQALLKSFCASQGLPDHYISTAESYFLPLAEEINELSKQKPTLLVGINGCQGGGKSTLAALLEAALTEIYGKTVANLSIDDFYHTQSYRKELAAKIHPLFQTRGVPGTHDIELLQHTLSTLTLNQKNIAIPRFNKASDDRHSQKNWDRINGPADIIVLEGWCIGVTKQTSAALLKPINTLEQKEDPQGIWRNKINMHIDDEYTSLFSNIDHLLMLKAPSFQCVYDWRQNQEDKLRQANTEARNNNSGVMDNTELTRFIEHYQRLTEHMLCFLPQQANVVFELNIQHQIIGRKDNGNQ